METVKGILIGLNTKEVVEVEVDEEGHVKLDELYRLVKCSLVTVVSFEENIDAFVDDEGLLKSGNFVQEIGYLGYTLQLAGNLLFLGSDEEGSSIGLTELEVEHLMTSLSNKLIGFVR